MSPHFYFNNPKIKPKKYKAEKRINYEKVYEYKNKYFEEAFSNFKEDEKFKKFIEVNEEVDETKLNNLYDRGEIKKKQIEDCYEVKLGEPYIRITEQKV